MVRLKKLVFYVIVLTLLLAGPGFAVSFEPVSTHNVGTVPDAVTTADLNGDGKPDIITANVGSNNVSVILGAGGGAFSEATHFQVGAAPVSVIVGDFNRDGKMDIATANSGGNDISILLGVGDGTFGAADDYAVGEEPISLASGDFNGDGRPDLAVARRYSNEMAILLGAGDGTFAMAGNCDVGVWPYALTTGDFNGDGNLDIVTTNHMSNDVSLLLGAGDGTFGAAAYFTVSPGSGTFLSSVTAGDFNRDGKLDIAVVNLTDNLVAILSGTGVGSFGAASQYPVGAQPRSVITTDLNGDGKPDLITANADSENISVFLGIGDGTFLASGSYAAGPGATAVVAADLNGDGKPDLAVANWSDNSVSIMVNNTDFEPAGVFAASALFPVGSVSSVITHDFNRDGRLDIVTVNSGTNNVSILLGAEDGTFGPAANYATGMSPSSAAAGDFNKDGALDIAVANTNGNSVSMLLGSGNGTFGPAADSTVGVGPNFLASGDFNRDGNLDLIVSLSGDASISVLLGTGNGTFADGPKYLVGWVAAISTGDFNSDGIPDIVAITGGSISILVGVGDGTFSNPSSFPVGQFPITMASGDFNGDGKLDIAVVNGNNYGISILLGTGDGMFEPEQVYASGIHPLSIVARDFDRDGTIDIATNDIITLLGSGDGSFGTILVEPINTTGALAAGDFNRDGRLDLVVSVWSDVAILLNTVPDTTPDPFFFPDLTDVPVNTSVESLIIAVNGINYPSPISVSGGEYAVSTNWGLTWSEWTSQAGKIGPEWGVIVKVRQTSSSSYSTTTNTTLTIGGVFETFSLTTIAPPWTLTVSINGDGSGTVVGPELECTTYPCEQTYIDGFIVELTAAPASGSVFNGWTGCDLVNGNRCLVAMTEAKNVTASFRLITAVKVVSPNGGETLAAGEADVLIKWSGPANAYSFRVKYSCDNGVTWLPVVNDPVIGFSYLWDVPPQIQNRKKCLIKVVGYDANNVKVGVDVSDAPFAIEVVKLTSPNGGAPALTSGQQVAVTWNTNATKRPVARAVISYSKDGGTTWIRDGYVNGNPGTYDWKVPVVVNPKNNCKVKVELKDAAGIVVGSDVSDAVFSIALPL